MRQSKKIKEKKWFDLPNKLRKKEANKQIRHLTKKKK